MKLASAFAALYVSLWCSWARADSMSSKMPTGSIHALSPLAAGVLGGVLCNNDVHPEVGGAFLKGKLGENEVFSLDGLSQAIWFVTAQRMLQEQLGGIPTGGQSLKHYCDGMLKAFGPNGTTIKGLISP